MTPRDELYAICKTARKLLVAPDNIQRVIARPFIGDESSGFTRTAHRKDFPLPPPEPNVLQALSGAGKNIHGIGVIVDLFPRRYYQTVQRTQANADHLAAVKTAMAERRADFIFANCEDFDMLYGHRNDMPGFARCINQFDQDLGQILNNLDEEDLLILCADHGNDPSTASTDHSREYVPLIVKAAKFDGKALGIRQSMADIGAAVAKWLQTSWSGAGESVV